MNILDKKSKEELEKHKNNCYKYIIKNRTIKLNITDIFNCDNIVKKDFFLIKIDKFTGFEGHYYFNETDPLVNTAKELINNKNLKSEESYLFNYYKNFQPKTLGELYKVNINNKLHNIKSTKFFHPWIHKAPTNIFRAGLFGPKDITNVHHRIFRLLNLINNIEKYNYKPSKSDIIEGYILLKNEDYRFLITAGHHRIAVLTAMYMNGNQNYEFIKVKYDNTRVNIKIVDENKINEWPAVKSGYLSKEDALEIFTSYFI